MMKKYYFKSKVGKNLNYFASIHKYFLDCSRFFQGHFQGLDYE